MIVFTSRYKVDYLETLRNSSEGFERFKRRHLDVIKSCIFKMLGEQADVDTLIQWVYKKVGIHHQILKGLKNPEKYFDVIIAKIVEEYVFMDQNEKDSSQLDYLFAPSSNQYFQELFDQIYNAENITHQQKLIVGLRMQGCSVIEIAESLEIHPRIIKRKLEKAFKVIR